MKRKFGSMKTSSTGATDGITIAAPDGNGGGVSVSSMAAESAPVAEPQVFRTLDTEGSVSFDAFYMGRIVYEGVTVDTSKRMPTKIRLLPLGHTVPMTLQSLLEGDIPKVNVSGTTEQKPLFRAATADYQALQFLLCKKKHDTKIPGSNKFMSSFEPIEDPRHLLEAQLHTGDELEAGIWLPEKCTDPDRVLGEPYTFVRIYGYHMETYKDKKTNEWKMSISIGQMSSAPHPELNRLRTVDRIDLAMPINHQSRIPKVDPYLAYKSHLDSIPNKTNMDKKAIAKAEREVLREAGKIPRPIWRVPVVQDWSLATKYGPEGPKDSVLIWHGYNPDETKAPMTGPLFSVASTKGAGNEGYTLMSPKTDTKNEALRLSFSFHAQQPRLKEEDGSIDTTYTEKFWIHEATLFAKHFPQLGFAYAPYLSAFLGCTRVPMEIIMTVDPRQTASIANNDPGARGNVYPEGVIIPEVLGVEARLRETIERRGIPCTFGLVKRRYGDKSEYFTPVVPGDYQALNATLKVRNPFNPVEGNFQAVYDKYHMTSLDEAPHAVPDSDVHVRYFAMPGVFMSKKPPMIQRADPMSLEKPEDIPEAVNLTPEEGDKFILEQFPVPPTTKNDSWLILSQIPGGVSIPRFFFFALFDEPAATTQARFPEILPPTPHVPTAEELKTLPRNMEALRAHIANTLIDPRPVAAAAALKPDVKNNVEEKKVAEPPLKRARMDSPKKDDSSAVAENDPMDFDD